MQKYISKQVIFIFTLFTLILSPTIGFGEVHIPPKTDKNLAVASMPKASAPKSIVPKSPTPVPYTPKVYNESEALMAEKAYVMESYFDYPKASIMSVKNGKWSDPLTWNLGRVPKDGDIVELQHAITFDLSDSPKIAVLNITFGSLKFVTKQSTKLNVGYLYIAPNASFQIGANGAPLPTTYKAEVVFLSPDELNTFLAPYGYTKTAHSPGVVSLGKFEVYGATKNKTFGKLKNNASKGSDKLTLLDTVAVKTGDTIVVPDVSYVAYGNDGPMTETAVVAHVNENEITLTAPLKFDHISPEGYTPYIAVLTRNVIFRSAQPQSAQMTFTGGKSAKTTLSYASFEKLGGKEKMFDALHFHMLHQYGKNVRVLGNSVTQPGKSCINVHSSSYGNFKNNVCYMSYGNGIYFYMGDEWGNTVDHNIVIKTLGSGGRSFRGDASDHGHAFWFRGPGNSITNNVATGGGKRAGFSLNFSYLPSQPIPDQNGNFTMTDLQHTKIQKFENNEVHGPFEVGLEIWDSYNTEEKPTLVKNFIGTNTFNFIFPYAQSYVIYDKTIGKNGYSGFSAWDYVMDHVTIQNSRFENFSTGIVPSSISKGGFVVKNSYLKNNTDIATNTLWYVNPNNVEEVLVPRVIIIQDSTLDGKIKIKRAYKSTPCYCDYDEIDRLFVVNHNGTDKDYEIFYTTGDLAAVALCTDKLAGIDGYTCASSEKTAYQTLQSPIQPKPINSP